MKAKAGGTACAVAYEKPKSQVKKSYECTGAMAVQEPSEADMDFLEQIFKKSDKPAPKTRAVSKASEIAPPPARTIAIAKETTPPPSKSKVLPSRRRWKFISMRGNFLYRLKANATMVGSKPNKPSLEGSRISLQRKWDVSAPICSKNATEFLSIRWRASVMKSGLEIIPAQIEK